MRILLREIKQVEKGCSERIKNLLRKYAEVNSALGDIKAMGAVPFVSDNEFACSIGGLKIDQQLSKVNVQKSINQYLGIEVYTESDQLDFSR